MYKGASQSRQAHLSRQSVFDAAVVAARDEAVPLSKKQQRKNFAAAIGELERQIAMSNPGSARRRELGKQKLALQLQREREKGIGIGGGKANQKRISDIFREKIFAVLPDDAQRIWDDAVTQEAVERQTAIATLSD